MKQIIAVFCLLVTTLTAHGSLLNEMDDLNQTKQRVLFILSEASGRPIDSIKEDQALVQDLKMNQAALESVRDSISAEVGYNIGDEKAEKITTVQKAINFVIKNQYRF